MISWKWFVLAAGALVAIAFLTGFIFWNKDPYSCFDGNKRMYGEWVTVWAAGKLEFRTRPWGCPKDARYDPDEWESLYGPKGSPLSR